MRVNTLLLLTILEGAQVWVWVWVCTCMGVAVGVSGETPRVLCYGTSVSCDNTNSSRQYYGCVLINTAIPFPQVSCNVLTNYCNINPLLKSNLTFELVIYRSMECVRDSPINFLSTSLYGCI